MDLSLVRPNGFYPSYYLHTYRDVAQQVGDDPNRLREHFFSTGLREGRSPNPLFFPKYYVGMFPTVRDAVGEDFQAAWRRWVDTSEDRQNNRGSPLIQHVAGHYVVRDSRPHNLYLGQSEFNALLDLVRRLGRDEVPVAWWQGGYDLDGQTMLTSPLKRLGYLVHMDHVGWQQGEVWDGMVAGAPGKPQKLRAIQVRGIPSYLRYRVHVSYDGWLPWVSGGEVTGVTGRTDRWIEAIEFKTTNQIAGIAMVGVREAPHIWGRCFIDNHGWQEVRGGMFGTTGRGLPLQAIQLFLWQHTRDTIQGGLGLSTNTERRVSSSTTVADVRDRVELVAAAAACMQSAGAVSQCVSSKGAICQPFEAAVGVVTCTAAILKVLELAFPDASAAPENPALVETADPFWERYKGGIVWDALTTGERFAGYV